MTSDQANDARLGEIMEEARKPDADLEALLSEAIPLLEGRLKPLELQALKHHLYGFRNQTGIEYYQKPPIQKWEHGYMPYRAMVGCERPGRLVVIKEDGLQHDVQHELAQRKEFFISARTARLQELLRTAGDTAIVELPDLTEYIGEQEGGMIALVVDKKHIAQMVDGNARGLVALIDLAITPGRREALEAAAQKPNGL